MNISPPFKPIRANYDMMNELSKSNRNFPFANYMEVTQLFNLN